MIKTLEGGYYIAEHPSIVRFCQSIADESRHWWTSLAPLVFSARSISIFKPKAKRSVRTRAEIVSIVRLQLFDLSARETWKKKNEPLFFAFVFLAQMGQMPGIRQIKPSSYPPPRLKYQYTQPFHPSDGLVLPRSRSTSGRETFHHRTNSNFSLIRFFMIQKYGKWREIQSKRIVKTEGVRWPELTRPGATRHVRRQTVAYRNDLANGSLRPGPIYVCF